MKYHNIKKLIFLFFAFVICFPSFSQGLNWSKAGNSYYTAGKSSITEHVFPDMKTKEIVSSKQLTPAGSNDALQINWFGFSNDEQKVLIFTKTKRVWRLNTKG